MMMMGGMGGSGGSGSSMGMMDMDMMGMGGGASQSMNGMNMGSMGNMPGMGSVTDPSMAGMANHGASTGIFGSGGTGLDSMFGGIFNLAIDLLAILLVVGLVAGTVILIKRYVFDGELFTSQTKTACAHCGSKLESNWNCCPKCGTVKINAQKFDVSPQTV